MSAVELELLRPGGHLARVRCASRGHGWSARLLGALLVLSCGRCRRTLACELYPASSQRTSVDVTRDALDLAAVVLDGGPQEQYRAHVDALVRTPRDSLQVLARLLLALAGDQALSDVRHMALMHALRDVEAVQ